RNGVRDQSVNSSVLETAPGPIWDCRARRSRARRIAQDVFGTGSTRPLPCPRSGQVIEVSGRHASGSVGSGAKRQARDASPLARQDHLASEVVNIIDVAEDRGLGLREPRDTLDVGAEVWMAAEGFDVPGASPLGVI